MVSQSILTQINLSQDQFIADLTSLFKRRNIRFGEPQDLEHLASDLASDEAFRNGLFNLCTVISHMTEVEPTPQELLALVARVSGGPGIIDSEGAIAIPASVETAFLSGYEAWTTRELDLSAFAESRHSDPFHTALSLAAADGSRPAPDPPRSIPPNAPIDGLTLGELRQYLNEIERSVSYIEPHLDQLPHNGSSSTPHAQQLATEASQKAPKITPLAEETPNRAPSPELTAKPMTPDVTRAQRPALPLSIFSADEPEPAIPTDATPHPADTARLRRLRIANIILAILLVISVTFAAAVAYRYLHTQDQPAQLAAAVDRAPTPAIDSASQPIAPPSSSGAAPPASPPRTLPTTSRDTNSPQTSQTASPAATQPDVIVFPSPAQPTETKPPAPVVRQEPGSASTNAQMAPSTEASPVAAPAAIPAPILRSPQPANTAVRVRSARMMSYAISTPQPVPPATGHSPETTVKVAAIISQDGRVTSAQALSGTPDARPAAIQAMQAWRFKPYLINGKPVEVITTFKFLFKSQ